MSVHQTENGRWFVKYYKDGKAKKEYFEKGINGERSAKKRDQEIKAQKLEERDEDRITVKELLGLYHSSHLVEKSTASSDRYRIERIITPKIGHFPVEKLGTQELNQYVLSRLKEGRKKRTVDRELDILKAAVGWAQTHEPALVGLCPVSKFRIKGADVESIIPAVVSLDELAAIVAHSPEHLMRGVVIGFGLGVRPGGEVRRIKWRDVDMTRGKIRIEGARKGGRVIRNLNVDSDSELGNRLSKWRELDLRLLGDGNESQIWNLTVVHYRLKPVLCMKHSWSTAKEKAGITRKLRLYDLRHDFATYVLEAGADLKATSEYLGHSRVDTTMRFYQHTNERQYAEIAAKVPKLPGYYLGTKSEKDGNE